MPTDCPAVFFADAGDVDCFRIDVPERHGTSGERRVTLFVSILRADADAPPADPVVYLAGGPGGAAVEAVPGLADSALRSSHDLILFEQRGTALTDPYLGCPALDHQEVFFSADPGTEERFAEQVGAAAADCAQTFEADGVDLAAFTTAASVEDLEVVRQALGIASWHLYAGSYGTRLALELIRHHPESVRSAVLEGLDPPDSDRIIERAQNLASAFAAANDACAADPACAARFGDLEALFGRALDRWRGQPETVYARISADVFTSVLVDAGAVSSLTFALLATDPGTLPLVLEQLADGDPTIFELTDYQPGLAAEAMRLSIECAESIARVDVKELEASDAAHGDLGLAFRRFPELVACERWPVVAADPAAAEPVSSDVPLLLISGALDPITPPSVAERAGRTLSRSRHLVIPAGGHGVTFSDACAMQAAEAFLDDPDTQLPVCERPAPFLTDVVDVPALADAWRSIFAPRLPSGSPQLSIVVVGTGLAVALLLSLLALVRGSRSSAVGAIALTAATLLGLGGLIAWGWLSNPPIVGMIGMPKLLAWIPWATSIAAGLGMVALIQVIRTTLRDEHARRHRLLLLASTIPILAAIWLLAANRLALPPV
jgi:pimeloyl-ACP methyl ester carboxylesterase